MTLKIVSVIILIGTRLNKPIFVFIRKLMNCSVEYAS